MTGRLVMALSLLAAAAPAAHARAITRATIVVGRGVNGATLDMTRRQVVARLGAPIGHSGQGVLSG